MEVKDIIIMLIVIAMVVVVGVLMINMAEGWMSSNGLIQTFMEDIFDIVIGNLKTMIQ